MVYDFCCAGRTDQDDRKHYTDDCLYQQIHPSQVCGLLHRLGGGGRVQDLEKERLANYVPWYFYLDGGVVGLYVWIFVFICSVHVIFETKTTHTEKVVNI